ncbi:MAG: hypothetical protein J6I31_04085 [Prevotella sp.]|nr:hypothetical protein [Prevotella sp.]
MSFLSKLFSRKDSETTERTGGMEDFMTLIRVYFQAVMAADLGITNIAMLPDLRVFKTTLHVATVNNKLGVGEKSRCKKMLKDIYEMDDAFFKEIDQSIRKRCRRLQDVQPYMLQFQAFTNDTMMLVSNLMKYKLRIPSMFKKTLYSMTEQTVNDIFTKNDFKDAGEMKTAVGIREYARRLDFSQQWTTNFVFKVIMLAKKEPRPKDEDSNTKKS